MSNSLVHKSLELFGYETNLRREKKNRKRKDVKYKGILDLIPAKHRIISKHNKTDLDANLDRSSKVTVYETQKWIAAQQDPTNENVQRLLLLSDNHVNPETTNDLFHRAVKKRYITKDKKPETSEKTAFTEEDFEKFQQEHIE